MTFRESGNKMMSVTQTSSVWAVLKLWLLWKFHFHQEGLWYNPANRALTNPWSHEGEQAYCSSHSEHHSAIIKRLALSQIYCNIPHVICHLQETKAFWNVKEAGSNLNHILYNAEKDKNPEETPQGQKNSFFNLYLFFVSTKLFVIMSWPENFPKSC